MKELRELVLKENDPRQLFEREGCNYLGANPQYKIVKSDQPGIPDKVVKIAKGIPFRRIAKGIVVRRG